MLKPTLLLAALLCVAAMAPGQPGPIQPGRWTTTLTITDIHVPGALPRIAAMMRGHPTTVSACVTPAQAAAGPRAVADRSGGRCRYTSFTMSGGHIEGSMVCAQPGSTMTMHSTGSYTPTSMTMDASGQATGRSPMTMRSHAVSRRTGAC
ncbi:DUF3617 domain-containing protein [Sphingomonas sp.]|uniref:DUF3617 domain-containing protein n=1 Tax=Sphingomonas sp. TaxID=28214 RepID=UPI003CC5B473